MKCTFGQTKKSLLCLREAKTPRIPGRNGPQMTMSFDRWPLRYPKAWRRGPGNGSGIELPARTSSSHTLCLGIEPSKERQGQRDRDSSQLSPEDTSTSSRNRWGCWAQRLGTEPAAQPPKTSGMLSGALCSGSPRGRGASGH